MYVSRMLFPGFVASDDYRSRLRDFSRSGFPFLALSAWQSTNLPGRQASRSGADELDKIAIQSLRVRVAPPSVAAAAFNMSRLYIVALRGSERAAMMRRRCDHSGATFTGACVEFADGLSATPTGRAILASEETN
ncbi:MAG: hypothetical protein ACREV5_13955 [Steroidobacter sp.]